MFIENKLHRLTERESRLALYFELFGGLWLLLRYLASSSTKSGVIFLLGDPDFQLYLASFLRSHFGLFGDLGLLMGYLASSGAKSDVIFLLIDPDFL